MCNYNKKAIRDAATSEVVANYIGMDLYPKGTYNFIYCPAPDHTESKPDSCWLTDHGYHCAACGDKGSTIKMVMLYKGCSEDEAYGICADAIGGREKYQMSGDYVPPSLPFSQSELELVGLQMYVKAEGYVPAFGEEGKAVSFDGDITHAYQVKEESSIMSLYDVYNSDRQFFYEMVYGKAVEKRDSYTNLLTMFTTEDGCPNVRLIKALTQIPVSEQAYGFYAELKLTIMKLEEIISLASGQKTAKKIRRRKKYVL